MWRQNRTLSIVERKERLGTYGISLMQREEKKPSNTKRYNWCAYWFWRWSIQAKIRCDQRSSTLFLNTMYAINCYRSSTFMLDLKICEWYINVVLVWQNHFYLLNKNQKKDRKHAVKRKIQKSETHRQTSRKVTIFRKRRKFHRFRNTGQSSCRYHNTSAWLNASCLKYEKKTD
jgi:hypothetical protein